jgi:hypothetical protein
VNDAIEQLLRSSAAEIPEPPRASTARARRRVVDAVADRRTEPSYGQTRRWVSLRLLAATVIVIAIGGAVVVALHSRGRPQVVASGRHIDRQVGASRGIGPRFSVSSPLLGGQVVSLATASADVGQQLPVPTIPTADPSTMGKVFAVQTSGDAGTTDTNVAITYPTSSLVVEYETPVPYPDPAANYQAYVDQTPANLTGLASVGQVGPHPALIIQENKDSTGSNPASVEFVTSNLKVTVIGFQPATTLLAIAQSINANSNA